MWWRKWLSIYLCNARAWVQIPPMEELLVHLKPIWWSWELSKKFHLITKQSPKIELFVQSLNVELVLPQAAWLSFYFLNCKISNVAVAEVAEFRATTDKIEKKRKNLGIWSHDLMSFASQVCTTAALVWTYVVLEQESPSSSRPIK